MLQSKMKDGKILYSFVSDATRNSPATGVKRIAKIVHNNNIPISWVVNQKTAQNLKDIFIEFIEKYNDDFIFKLQSENQLFDNRGMESKWLSFDKIDNFEKYLQLLNSQKANIEKILGIKHIRIAQLTTTNIKYIDALKSANFDAIWGVDFINDTNDQNNKKTMKYNKGAPFGIYNINNHYYIPENNKSSKKNEGMNYRNSMIALEKSFMDINKGFFSNKPQKYTSELLEICKEGICDQNNIGFLKNMIDQYVNNAKYNKIITMVHHQAAHEMEFTTTNNFIQLPAEIDDMAIVLDKTFKYIKKHDKINIVSLNEMVSLFKEDTSIINSPKYFYFTDKLIPNMKYHKKRWSKWNKRKHHYKKLKFAIKRAKNNANFIDIPEIYPQNGKNFPPVFVFQNNKTKIFFKIAAQNEENKEHKGNKITHVVFPLVHYLYTNNKIKEVKSNLEFLKQDVNIDENKLSIEFSIKTSKDYPWGIIIDKKINYVEFESKNDNTIEIFNKESIIGENFAFFYLHLTTGLNNFKITAKF